MSTKNDTLQSLFARVRDDVDSAAASLRGLEVAVSKAERVGALVNTLRDRNVTGTHIEIPGSLLDDVMALFQALGLENLASRCTKMRTSPDDAPAPAPHRRVRRRTL